MSLSWDYCGNVYIVYCCNSEYNPTCSRECYVKNITLLCIDCQNNFLKTLINLICSSCYTLNKRKLEKYNPEELKKMANIYEKKELIVNELLETNHLLLQYKEACDKIG